jgi:hypothetical protein
VSWAEMMRQRGEWGRDGAIYFAVRHGGWRLVEVLREIGPGLKYQAAAQGAKRFKDGVEQDLEKAQFLKKMKSRLGEIKQ